MKRFRAAALLVLLGLSARADAQTVTLRYGWTKGETRNYRITTLTDSVITGLPNAPGPMTTVQTMTQVLKFLAEDVAPDGSTTLRQTFQSIRLETTNPMGKFVVDTAAADTSQDPMAQSTRQFMNAMVGESVLIEMAPDGTVRRVDGASRIAEKITRMMAADPATAAAGQSLRTTLGDEALKTTLEQTFPRLALPPVKAADTWTGQLAMGNPAIGRITGRSTFTLKAVEGTADAPLARIAVSLVLNQDVVPPPSGPAAMVMTLGDARGAGEILFLVKRGQIQRSTMRTEMPSTVVMNGPDGSPSTVSNKTTITMTMEAVEK